MNTQEMERQTFLAMIRDAPVWLRFGDPRAADALKAGLARITHTAPGWYTLALTIEGKAAMLEDG